MEADRPGASTRAAVLEAAFSLFVQNGFHGTTMREVAREAGVSLGAAYNYFPSKEDIFRTLLAERNPYTPLLEALERIEDGPAEAMLRQAMQSAIAIFSRHPEFFRLFFVDMLEFQGANLGEVAAGIIPRVLGFFQRVVAQGARTGELRPIAPAVLMRGFAGLMMSGVLLERVASPIGGHMPVQDWGRAYADLLLRGVLVRELDPADPGAGQSERSSCG